MGCFDSVFVTCPHCSSEEEIQSKDGKCAMRKFRSGSVPLAIAGGIHGLILTCDSCGGRYRLYVDGPTRVRVLAEGIPAEPEEWEPEEWDDGASAD